MKSAPNGQSIIAAEV